ncbi:MAG: cytochrome c biogenesis protein CcsA [Alphaproteobacteria bacterium]|nr:cytochrome c biogenesis protein CcsA [Alphaproteobacteria bacterium]
MQRKLKQLYTLFTSAQMIFYLLPPLMVLLIVGTVAQKEMGLYAASKLFFAGPAAWALLGLLTFCLTLKFLFASPWSWGRSGIILSHLGALILLYGGGLTALTNEEGYLIVPEGQQSRTILDYHARSLVLLKDGQIHAEWDAHNLMAGHVLSGVDDIDIYIKSYCANCDITRRENVQENAFGMAAQVQLSEKPSEKRNEENISGVTFSVNNVEYILFDGFTKPLDIAGYELIYGRTQRRLPFTVELVDFERDLHPGMQMARGYSSDIIVHDGDVNWPVKIEMNKPLRYKGYTLFQADFVEPAEGPSSTILAVVKNKGWIFPYIGTLIMALGLLIHVFMRASVRRLFSVVILCMLASLLCAPKPAQATGLDYNAFANLPILHEGRIKPLESFARIYLERFSGRKSIDGQPAIVWLSEMVFDPVRAPKRPVFKVTHPDVRTQLDVSETDGRMFSLERIMPLLSETAPQLNVLAGLRADELSSGQKALLKLHEDAIVFMALMRSFSIIMPLNITLPDYIAKDFADETDDYITYLDLQPYQTTIMDKAKAIAAAKKDDWESYDEDEGRTIALSFAQNLLIEQNQQNTVFKILPRFDDRTEWVTPWEMIVLGQGSPLNKERLDAWAALLDAYQTQNDVNWSANIKTLNALYAENPNVSDKRLSLERIYNAFPWSMAVMVLYILAMVLAARFVFVPSAFTFTAAQGAALAGVILHGLIILFRIYVLARPPVGTLYESIIFVAFTAVCMGIIMDLKQKRGFALLASTVTGAMLLIIAPYFVIDGESLDVLVAVLNTSFWLTTHVLCITIGYAVCIVAAMCAHIHLIRSSFTMATGDKLALNVLRLSVVALFFTGFGTVLGGIWADQSWGRFWGWDPKENGALLIVLWIVWALHGRHAGKLSQPLFSAVIAYLNVVVTLSWFGVNLLNVGLHSYGFISGIAYAIAAVTIVETALITWLLIKTHKRKNR